jgi:hypothetical protein
MEPAASHRQSDRSKPYEFFPMQRQQLEIPHIDDHFSSRPDVRKFVVQSLIGLSDPEVEPEDTVPVLVEDAEGDVVPLQQHSLLLSSNAAWFSRSHGRERDKMVLKSANIMEGDNLPWDNPMLRQAWRDYQERIGR